MPMGMAEIAVALWTRHLRHNPADPHWADRDRFVLSNGHGSMLQYALLHLSGYALPIDEIKHFRQLNSMTPGHPEVGVTPGVETTTGPLGQGLANAVGMALAERLLAAQFNRPGHENCRPSAKAGFAVRVVSMPCTSLFDRQNAAYRASVLAVGAPRVAVEAGVTGFWHKYVGAVDDSRAAVGIDRFGESAPAGVLFKHFGFTVENVVAAVRRVLE